MGLGHIVPVEMEMAKGGNITVTDATIHSSKTCDYSTSPLQAFPKNNMIKFTPTLITCTYNPYKDGRQDTAT